MSEIKRRFETIEAAGWMLYSVNDLLYGMMQSLATYNEKDENKNHRLYVTKEVLGANKTSIADVLGSTKKTVDNNIKKLIDQGLLEEFELNGKAAYGIVINYDNPYKLLDLKWLTYLINTRNKFCLKIYVYLLDKFDWKIKDNDYFYFTIRNIREAMGYSSNGQNRTADVAIDNVLKSFYREGIIDFVEEYSNIVLADGREVTVLRKKLLCVATSEEGMENIRKSRQGKNVITG